MKKNFLFSLIIALVTFSSCEWHEMEMAESQMIMSMSGGFSSSSNSSLYAEVDVMTGIKISSTDSLNKITSASWTIGEKNYDGVVIVHKFINVGEQDVSIVARFQNNEVKTKTYKVQVVKDLSNVGPVVIKVNKVSANSSYDVWIGWDRRWLKRYTTNEWSIIGDATKWTKVPLIAGQFNYNLDSSGNPKTTTDAGSQYVGAWINLKEPGYNKMVLVAKNGEWVDISGSPYSKSGDTGIVHFQVNSDGSVTPKGDGGTVIIPGETLPGVNGDNYFRYNDSPGGDGKVSVFFRLDSNWTNKAFAIRGLNGGEFTTPIQLNAVTDFPEWGKLEVTYLSMLENVSKWRYGSDLSKATEFSLNMSKSFFYDETFKSLSLQLVGFQAAKKQE